MVVLFILFTEIISTGFSEFKAPSIDIIGRNGIIQAIIVENVPSSLSCQLFLSKDSANPILGEWQSATNRLTFIPAVPLNAHDTYYIQTSEKKHPWLRVEAKTHNGNDEIPSVVNIYPSANELPENLLRFYVEFSQPMREEDFISNILFQDEQGNDLTGVFLPSKYEYWNKERTVITLIFDPGRVKTGLQAHKKMGRALQNGKKYRLVIKSSCQALSGKLLGQEYSKEFAVTEEVNSAIDPDKWAIKPPLANTNDPLIVEFDRHMDHLNASAFIGVFDHTGRQISGNIELSKDASIWSFFPEKSWEEENYKIMIYNKLEDICGNNLIHGFDVLKASEIARTNKEVITEIEFNIGND